MDQPTPTGPQPLRKEHVPVRIRSTVGEIEGVAHFFSGARISDYLNRPDIQFLPLTDVVVHDSHGGKDQSFPFLALNKNEIIYLVPREGC